MVKTWAHSSGPHMCRDHEQGWGCLVPARRRSEFKQSGWDEPSPRFFVSLARQCWAPIGAMNRAVGALHSRRRVAFLGRYAGGAPVFRGTLLRLLPFVGMAVAAFAAVSAWSADTNSTVRERAAAAPATNTFQVKPGFRIELVAAEPMIASPVAMAFDENGRLFVVELPAGQNPR